MTPDDDVPLAPAGQGDESSVADDAESAGGDGHAVRRRLPIWQELLLLVAAAVVLAIVAKALFVQAFYIPSDSMEPGLVKDDRILVQKVSSWFGGSPHRGDVIVFRDPGGWAEDSDDPGPLQGVLSAIGLYPEGGHLVKRVVGVAGDVITCCDEQGRILVNGTPVDEEGFVASRPAGITCDGPMIGCDWSAGPVPDGKLFVMGDNRSNSADSTVHLCLPDDVDCARDPYVDVDLVVGTVFAVAWPLSHLRHVGGSDELRDAPSAGR
ncbi:signal peptidase I [Nocardioides plantarum]|uniref:Signal peptidase I n=1 Tax=Nocardioides plantarum TaxID=29299 RepID=A0ABV5KAU9_9ACTN|nr:signal peptidase I [Nocardioides plantarum]